MYGKLNNKFMTLKSKIIVMLIAITLVPLNISGTFSYFTSLKLLSNKLETTSRQTTHEITRGLDNYFSAMSNMIKILANDINIKKADDTTYFEFAKGLIANSKATDKSILNVYVGTEKGMFYTDPFAELPEEFDHKKRDWYIEAVSKPNEVVITNPYVDTATKKIVISIVSTINNDGIVGVVGMDIDLESLSKSLSEIKVGDSGYILITDKTGHLIAHPDKTLIGTDTPTTLSFWDEATKNKQGFAEYKYKKAKKFASYDTSTLTGWKVISSMNYSELSKDTSSIQNMLIVVLIFAIIAAVVIAILFSNPISKNIRKLLSAFDRMAHGDLTTTLSIKSKDEFNLLGKHFNEMATNISTLIHNVSVASHTVLDTSITLANMAEETNASLGEVARAVEEVAKGATEQAQYASDGANSISELADELGIIDESTDTINQLSKNTSGLTLQGLNRVEDLIQKSDITMQSTAKVSGLVYETSESIHQIRDISNTIDTITAQTNLLALNASIEAARAGESGKGFSVVADEIRKLADQSKASTVKIKEIVEDISQKTALSVEAMEITNKNVEEQVSLVNQTQKLFHDIMKAVQVLSDKVTEIKQNTKEITEQKDNIVSQIENISAISEESASATEEVTASAEQITVTMDEITQQALDLQKLSEELQEKINSFRIS